MSTCKGETAIGNGSRFPRVMSISINAKDLFVKNILNKNSKVIFSFNLLAFLLD